LIKSTLERLKRNIVELENSHPEWSKETSALIERLQNEILELEGTDADTALSITNFTQSSVHETIRTDPSIEMRDLSLSALQKSIYGFETSHPELVHIINGICTRLSQLGI
jgi:hypothetical protein